MSMQFCFSKDLIQKKYKLYLLHQILMCLSNLEIFQKKVIQRDKVLKWKSGAWKELVSYCIEYIYSPPQVKQGGLRKSTKPIKETHKCWWRSNFKGYYEQRFLLRFHQDDAVIDSVSIVPARELTTWMDVGKIAHISVSGFNYKFHVASSVFF